MELQSSYCCPSKRGAHSTATVLLNQAISRPDSKLTCNVFGFVLFFNHILFSWCHKKPKYIPIKFGLTRSFGFIRSQKQPLIISSLQRMHYLPLLVKAIAWWHLTTCKTDGGFVSAGVPGTRSQFWKPEASEMQHCKHLAEPLHSFSPLLSKHARQVWELRAKSPITITTQKALIGRDKLYRWSNERMACVYQRTCSQIRQSVLPHQYTLHFIYKSV